MRWLIGGLGAAALATVLGACAAIAGLGPYSSEDCSSGECDASTHPKPPDGTVGSDDGPGTGDDGGPTPGDDGGQEAGCPDGLLECDGGCASPTAATSCGGCDIACGGDAGLCAPGDGGTFGCVSSCPASAPTDCTGTCTNTSTDPNNCGGCGSAFACTPGQACIGGVCMSEGGGDAGDGGVTCPDSGCPSSANGYSCPTLGTCNGATNQCNTPGGCFCKKDSDCKSAKCVKVARENDVSCGSNCTGSGSRDGFDCELASPGIPSLGGGGGTYSCPASSGYKSTTLACDPSHTNCYCTADAQCPSGKCVPSGNNGCTAPACTGTGSPDYRGCVAIDTLPTCLIYVGSCPLLTSVCSYPVCYCSSDAACASGHCIPSAHNANCSGCTGTGADDGHGCQPAPSSVACVGTGGTVCTTTLTPPPVINSGKTACLCVTDSNCSSGKCVNKDTQCTGTCTGSGSADTEDCQTATSVPNMWSCDVGNCSNVSSPTGQCTAAGVPCWCTSDSQCPGGSKCAAWSGCSADACTGSGTASSFHCVP